MEERWLQPRWDDVTVKGKNTGRLRSSKERTQGGCVAEGRRVKIFILDVLSLK